MTAERRLPRCALFDRRTIALALVIALLAGGGVLLLRWKWTPKPDSTRFEPRPDGLEYVAGAQSIARDGRFLLRLGPHVIRSRYPPGWPMILAGALKLGVPPQLLVRVQLGLDAVIAAMLALAAGLGMVAIRRALGRPATSTEPVAVGAAGLVAGLVVGFAWWHVLLASYVHSDAGAFLFAACALASWAAAWNLPQEATAGRWLVSGLAGLAFGMACATRPIEGALVAPAMATVPWLSGNAARVRLWARSGFGFAAGLFLPLSAVILLLARSGLPVTRWSGYYTWRSGESPALWVPWSLERIFNQSSEVPSWQSLTAILFGYPGGQAIGRLWPVAGWLTALLLWRELRRRDSAAARSLHLIVVALLVWTAAHLIFYFGYGVQSPRFYLSAHHTATLFAALAVGLGVASKRWLYRSGALLLGLWIGATTIAGYLPMAEHFLRAPRGEAGRRLEENFELWQEMGVEDRVRLGMPFDPLEAQAMGWLDERSAGRVEVWGPLPPTQHSRRLLELGRLEESEVGGVWATMEILAPGGPSAPERAHALASRGDPVTDP